MCRCKDGEQILRDTQQVILGSYFLLFVYMYVSVEIN